MEGNSRSAAAINGKATPFFSSAKERNDRKRRPRPGKGELPPRAAALQTRLQSQKPGSKPSFRRNRVHPAHGKLRTVRENVTLPSLRMSDDRSRYKDHFAFSYPLFASFRLVRFIRCVLQDARKSQTSKKFRQVHQGVQMKADSPLK